MGDNENEKRARNDNGTIGGKRQCLPDKNVVSQPSILKWMRHVPGPLQDVMKKRADQMDKAHEDHGRLIRASSDRYSVTIATVFDQGPWVDMCQYLGMPAVSGKLYGDIRVGSLECSVGSIVESDEALTKIPQLLVLLKSVRYVDEEIVAVLHDPTGEIEGYFHRDLVEQLGSALIAGAGVLLYKVSVFTPTDAPVTGRRKSYLNITPRNVRQVFVSRKHNTMTTDDPVSIFNKEKEIQAGQDSDNDDYDDNQPSRSEQAARQLLHHSTIRDTSAELTFLSQRQVIHRNPPVRLEPGVSTTIPENKSKMGKGNASQEQDSGLGKWQWSKLLNKTVNDEATTGGGRLQERQSFLDASSRLVSLITQQNAKHRESTAMFPNENSKIDDTSLASLKSKEVRFVPKVLSIPRNVEKSSGAAQNSESDINLYPAEQQIHADNKSITSDEDDDW